MRFHKIANVNKALQFIESKGVKLVSIGAEGTFKEMLLYQMCFFRTYDENQCKCWELKFCKEGLPCLVRMFGWYRSCVRLNK